jgi:hypothetical protein
MFSREEAKKCSCLLYFGVELSLTFSVVTEFCEKRKVYNICVSFEPSSLLS